MDKNQPFLSIVIANYNYGHLLPAALDSILSQDCDDYEIIVVDGGSKDNSVDVINKYENHIAWWVSEPDKGQSNAFNKGFSHAKGKFLTWLNADDILLPGTLTAVKKALTSKPSADYATGNFLRFLNSNCIVSEAKWGPNYLPYWLQGKGRYSVAFGPTTFWRRSVYEKLGPIDESLHYTMDTEYWARMMMAGHKQVRVNHYCWGFRMHEESKTAEFGEHERSAKIKETMDMEHNYIRNKTGYHPTKFWRYIGLIMRLFDGSLLKSVYNNYAFVGKDLIKIFKIDYKIK
jgi:glycosyltransferase involved in cell wall biosynthesis